MNPYQKQQKEYLKTKIQTASKEQLVLMLMDGVIRFSEHGRKAIAEKNYEAKQKNLVRSQDIVIELVNGLDHEKGGEIATNLARLYTYSIRRLVDANIKDDTAAIDEVQHIFRNLREAWAIAMDKVNKEKAANGETPVIESVKPEEAALPKIPKLNIPKIPKMNNIPKMPTTAAGMPKLTLPKIPKMKAGNNTNSTTSAQA